MSFSRFCARFCFALDLKMTHTPYRRTRYLGVHDLHCLGIYDQFRGKPWPHYSCAIPAFSAHLFQHDKAIRQRQLCFLCLMFPLIFSFYLSAPFPIADERFRRYCRSTIICNYRRLMPSPIIMNRPSRYFAHISAFTLIFVCLASATHSPSPPPFSIRRRYQREIIIAASLSTPLILIRYYLC